jgi:hypothetical protein
VRYPSFERDVSPAVDAMYKHTTKHFHSFQKNIYTTRARDEGVRSKVVFARVALQ